LAAAFGAYRICGLVDNRRITLFEGAIHTNLQWFRVGLRIVEDHAALHIVNTEQGENTGIEDDERQQGVVETVRCVVAVTRGRRVQVEMPVDVVSYVFREYIDHVFDCLFVGSLGLESPIPDRGAVFCGQGTAKFVQVTGCVFPGKSECFAGGVQEEAVSKAGGG
jgi:hypothetical protein